MNSSSSPRALFSSTSYNLLKITSGEGLDRLSAEVPSIPIFIIDCARSKEPYTELGAGSKNPAKVLIAPLQVFATVLDFPCKENTS
ncbi:hypothetical protein AKJ65_07155 [candidate division MSBL1 archaeon SCGC-AAA259E19]|uniref:Uncharacterized protein n=1 Tax=candidate division MSBL1 archaeon SCGC-AAA259E19 TaxID=1698264 RepID=A0A133UEQ0_9EURY|nr:hypothetical protein AKJ65_07155 [candidate division MSBL1 archaeon SCGC-AAA259E19]